MRIRSAQLSPWAIDIGLAVVLAALSFASLALQTSDELELYEREPDIWGYLLVLLMAVPLVWRRRHPQMVLMAVVAAFTVDRALSYPATTASFSVAVALFSLGLYADRRRAIGLGSAAVGYLLVFTTLGVFFEDSVSVTTLLSFGLILVLSLLLGLEVNTRRVRALTMEERANRVEQATEERARRAVDEERGRLARELHDVVAHEVSVMTVQAGAARRVMDTQPAEAKEAIRAVEGAGHQALGELRRMLGLLRQDDEAAGTNPQPRLARVDALVRQMEEAGLPTSLTIDGNPAALPAGVDLNAYRIIQEALTNTLKHAGPSAAADVVVRCRDEELVIEVTDDGHGMATSLERQPDQNGHGLVGMQERVALLDGELHTGPVVGGGYRVKARIPTRR